MFYGFLTPQNSSIQLYYSISFLIWHTVFLIETYSSCVALCLFVSCQKTACCNRKLPGSVCQSGLGIFVLHFLSWVASVSLCGDCRSLAQTPAPEWDVLPTDSVIPACPARASLAAGQWSHWRQSSRRPQRQRLWLSLEVFAVSGA